MVSVSTGGIIDSCLSFGPNSVPFVTYLDQSTNKLMFARLAAGTWVIGMVDSSAVTPISSSDVDQYGYLYVVYREYGSTNLKVARQVSTNSTSWAYSYPDNSSGVASAISIRADSYGYLHLAFYDMTNNQLVYATNNEGPWSHRVLSIAGSVDSKVSLCLDEYNKVHLAYIDGSNYDLKYFTGCQRHLDLQRHIERHHRCRRPERRPGRQQGSDPRGLLRQGQRASPLRQRFDRQLGHIHRG